MSKRKLPAYCHHKASGQAYVKLDGKRHYLGPHGSPESHQLYAEALGRWQAAQSAGPKNLTIRQLATLYWQHAQTYYVKNGKPSGHLHIVRNALKYLNRDCRNMLASNFGPKTLLAVRQRLIDQQFSRKYINDLTSVVKRMFKWATSQELVSPMVHHGLTTVGTLSKGRSSARETEPVRPVPMAFVNALERFVAPEVWGLIQFQFLTGARPGEALIVRPCDIDMTGDVWLYRPESHKTEHHGRDRIIAIGPQGQDIVKRFLGTDTHAYIFGPSKPHHLRGSRPYRRDSYTTAVKRGCVAAGVPPWSPNQLRHNFATEARRAFGIEAARVTLGHSSAVVSEIYAERDIEAARAVVTRIG